MVQLSHPYMTTGKTIALIIRTFVGKVRSLHFTVLSRFVRDKPFLPRSKHLLILWPQFLSTLISDPKKIKSATVSIFVLIWLLVNGGLTGDSSVIQSLL